MVNKNTLMYVRAIRDSATEFLNYIENINNECAYTDRILEQLKDYANKASEEFSKSLKGSLTDHCLGLTKKDDSNATRYEVVGFDEVGSPDVLSIDKYVICNKSDLVQMYLYLRFGACEEPACRDQGILLEKSARPTLYDMYLSKDYICYEDDFNYNYENTLTHLSFELRKAGIEVNLIGEVASEYLHDGQFDTASDMKKAAENIIALSNYREV